MAMFTGGANVHVNNQLMSEFHAYAGGANMSFSSKTNKRTHIHPPFVKCLSY